MQFDFNDQIENNRYIDVSEFFYLDICFFEI